MKYNMVKVKNDLTGKVFGKLTVMYQVEDYICPRTGKHCAKWHCICSCNEHNEIDVMATSLTGGNTRSCGCIKKFKDEEYSFTLEEKSYIYGLLLADGTFNISNQKIYSGSVVLEMQNTDEDIINKLMQLIPHSTKSYRNRNTNFKSNYNSVIFRNSRSSFIRMLVDFGMPIKNKSINAQPPIVEYDKNAFWRGVIDGDGSLGIRKNSSETYGPHLSLTTKSDTLKAAFCEYMSDITGKTYSPKRNKRDNIYNIGVGGYFACKILKEIYANSSIYLERKYQNYLQCLSWWDQNQIPKRNVSGVIGVYYVSKSNKWHASICINKIAYNLGDFDNKQDAIVARLQAEFEYYGKFAKQQHLFEKYGIDIKNKGVET